MVAFIVHMQWEVTLLCIWIVFAALQVKRDLLYLLVAFSFIPIVA